MRILIVVVLLLVVTGCASTNIFSELDVTSVDNFRSRLTITHYDTAYFTLPTSTTKNSCFPLTHATPVTCVMPDILADAPVEMQFFEFKLVDRRGYIGQTLSELQHLAISEVALARGFSKYVITISDEITSCMQTGPSAYTSGTVINGIYSGSTIVTDSTVCSSSRSAGVLMFNDATALAQGIVYKKHDGRYQLLATLYRGALPIKFDIYSGQTSDITGRSARIVPFKAWKSYYDSAGMATDLRKKYKVDAAPYTVIENRDVLKAEIEKNGANPLNKNRIFQ